MGPDDQRATDDRSGPPPEPEPGAAPPSGSAPSGAPGGRGRSTRAVVAVGVAVAVVVVAVAVVSLRRSGDDPAPPADDPAPPAGGPAAAPSGDAAEEAGWEPVPLDGVAPREGATPVVLGDRTVALAGGQVPGDPGRLAVDVVDLASGRAEPLAPLAVANPSVAGAAVGGGEAALLLASGEVVTFPADGSGAPRLAAGPAAAGASPQPAAAPPGATLVDLAAPARWDAAADAWRSLPPLPGPDPGYERRAAVTGDGGVVLAGFEAPTLVLAPGADAWRELPAPPLPAGADHIGQPVLAAAGDRVALVDELGNAALLAPGDGGWAPLEVPDDPAHVEGCELRGASTATVAVVDRCGDVLVVDGEGGVDRLDKPATPPQHAVASDGRQLVLLAWEGGALSLWRRPL